MASISCGMILLQVIVMGNLGEGEVLEDRDVWEDGEVWED